MKENYDPSQGCESNFSSLSNLVYNRKTTEKWKLLRTLVPGRRTHQNKWKRRTAFDRQKILPEPPTESAESRTICLSPQQLIITIWLKASKEQRKKAGDKKRQKCQIGMGIILRHTTSALNATSKNYSTSPKIRERILKNAG